MMQDRPTAERPERDLAFLRRAVALAVGNADRGQLPFGALVVRDGEVLASGVNSQLADHDPTAHAEVAAVRSACRRLGTTVLAGATLVSSCEPCAMCHVVAVAAGIGRIVYAATAQQVPPLDGGAAATDAVVLAAMQRLLRSTDPGRLVHTPVRSADAPFRRIATRNRAGNPGSTDRSG
jgi:guanine deaminase